MHWSTTAISNTVACSLAVSAAIGAVAALQ